MSCPCPVGPVRVGTFVRLRSVTHSFIRTGPIDMRVCILIASYEKSDSPLKVPPSVSLSSYAYDVNQSLLLVLYLICLLCIPVYSTLSTHTHLLPLRTGRGHSTRCHWSLHPRYLLSLSQLSLSLSLSSLLTSASTLRTYRRSQRELWVFLELPPSHQPHPV